MSERCRAENARRPWSRKGCFVAWFGITVWIIGRAEAAGPEVATTVWTVEINQWIIRSRFSRLREDELESGFCVLESFLAVGDDSWLVC